MNDNIFDETSEQMDGHGETSHQADSHGGKAHNQHDVGCNSVSEVDIDLLSEWSQGGDVHVHPTRPISEGIYTMDQLK